MRQALSPARVIRFGVYEVDLKSGELRRSGLKIKLQEQPFQVLATLLTRPGKVVTREELRLTVWPNDAFVDFDHGLAKAIQKLRDALGDSTDNPRFVETLPRRGYRFIYPVEGRSDAPHFDNPPAAGEGTRPQASLSDLPGSLVSHYRVLKEIDKGGMGIVYTAEDLRLERRVALKFLPAQLATDPKALGRFKREARTASALNHPNICTIYEVDEHQGRPFIAMELLEGQTLKDRLSGQPLDADQFARVSCQIAAALEAAHAKGIVHRDIKPANIFITREELVKILDFGLAKPIPEPGGGATVDTDLSTDGTSEGSLTTPGEAVGTIAYMSPEQLRGEKLDARSDVFSFGAVLYEMATGRQAFAGRTAGIISDAILNRDPEPPRQINPALPAHFDMVIRKALEKDRAKRYPTARALRQDLESTVKPIPGIYIWPKLGIRGRWVLALGALVVCVLAVLLIPAVRHRIFPWTAPVPIPEKRSVAVLPFVVLDGDPATAAFARDLTETLNAGLARLTERYSLQVTPANEVRGKDVTTAEEALKEFGASLVLETSLEQSEGSIRVAYLLIDTATRQQLRGDAITAPPADPLELKDEVASKALGALEAELAARESDFPRAYGTSHPAAYDYFWRGRRLLLDYQEPKNVEAAIAVFNHALEGDPQFALAHAGLGEAYLRRYEESKDSVWVSRALEACRSAVLNGMELPHGHACLGIVYNDTGKYEEAVTAFGRALTLDPNYVEAVQGQAHAYEMLRRPEQAERTYRQALRLRPGYWGGYRDMGQLYYRQGRYADAAAMYQRVIDLAPENPMGYVGLGGLYYLQGRWKEARALFEKSLTVRPTYKAYNNLATLYFFQERNYAKAARMFEKVLELNDKDYFGWGNLAAAYFWAPDERGSARAAYERAAKMAEEQRKVNPRDPKLLCDLADYYAMLGKRERALPLLEEALAPNDVGLMFSAGDTYEQMGRREESLKWIGMALERGYPIDVVERSPGLVKLRADPRFETLRNNR